MKSEVHTHTPTRAHEEYEGHGSTGLSVVSLNECLNWSTRFRFIFYREIIYAEAIRLYKQASAEFCSGN